MSNKMWRLLSGAALRTMPIIGYCLSSEVLAPPLYRHILFDIPALPPDPSRMNISLTKKQLRFTGPSGSLSLHQDDEVCRRLAMLIEGECEELGPSKAAEQ